MNISYNWLKELIDIDLSTEETAAALTRVGLAVEGIHPYKDDHVLDIDLTSNRPDCLSHLGIARELGVIVGRPLKNPVAIASGSDRASSVVTIEAPDLCHRFTARIIRGVRVGPSPQWLVDRLEALGERSINNVADITNFVMLELGHPMHAFDLDKLAENCIVVRNARAGEVITTLDEVERGLDETMLAICDAEKPVAVAGVMGGFDSGITETTTNVLLEVAYFKRESIRQTSRKLGLASEASYRFERGVDIENLIRASDRATDLIIELAGGTADDIIDLYPNPAESKTVESADISKAVKRLSGLDVETAECDRILNSLGITKERDSVIYTSPTWRHDIAIEEDLVEEVARYVGYENIGEELPPAFGAGEYQPHELTEKALRTLLQNNSFDEAITYSFIDTDWDDRIEPLWSIQNGGNAGYVTLRDSVIDGAVRMRTSCIPGLLDAARHNINHQNRDLKLFEIGKIFVQGNTLAELPVERKYLSLLITGDQRQESTEKTTRPSDFYDLKGTVESLLLASGRTAAQYQQLDARQFRRGQAALITVDNKVVGHLGRLSDELAKSMKFRKPVFLAELDLDRLFDLPDSPRIYRPLSKFPDSSRDITFLVDRSLEFRTLLNVLHEKQSLNCVNIQYYDVFSTEDSSERSITLRFTFSGSRATLTDEEIDTELKLMVDEVMTQFAGLVKIQ
jgi:phenylalanyl-tRNA synthetase beta chain